MLLDLLNSLKIVCKMQNISITKFNHKKFYILPDSEITFHIKTDKMLLMDIQFDEITIPVVSSFINLDYSDNLDNFVDYETTKH